jgi:hypothetical protein
VKIKVKSGEYLLDLLPQVSSFMSYKMLIQNTPVVNVYGILQCETGAIILREKQIAY